MWASYHVTREGPCEPHWPRGAWSVYRITGDQIAQRIKFDDDGKVVERHSWCGYLGMTETFDGVREMIEKDIAEQEAAQARQKKKRA